MAEEKITAAINFIKGFLKNRNLTLDKVILFGSYVKGNYAKDSDVDIAIISRDFNGRDIFQRAEMLKGLKWSLIAKFMIPFDIVPMSLKEWQEGSSLVVEFVREGQTI